MAAVAAHRREIDGLRAVAVIPVILFHAGLPAFGGGYVGVDVFFVISGFLITSVILAEQDAGTFSILRFYDRRARRILPALFFVVAATLPFAWFWMMPDRLKEYAQSVTAVGLFGSNIFFSQHQGYFDAKSEFLPLLHTWSLAVEEQYYLVAPLLLFVVGRLGRRAVLGTLLAIGAGSLAWAHLHARGDSSPDFYLVQSRAWELALGGVAGCLNTGSLTAQLSRVARETLALLGLSLILLAVFWFDRRTQMPGLVALIPTVGTAAVLLASSPDTLVGRWLGHRSVVAVGLVSYSAYLWHQPLFA
ncbi:MAG: acyltransferase, partial [Vicinamibacterales bacterium]